MAIIGGDQGKAGESKGSGRKADDLRLSCLCLLLPNFVELTKLTPALRVHFSQISQIVPQWSCPEKGIL